MTEINSFEMHSHDGGAAFDLLHGLIFKILLMTDGRTTDILETLLNDKMAVEVIRQEQIDEEHAGVYSGFSGAPHYVRESLLMIEKSRFSVSHNIALVDSKHVPPSLIEKIAHRQEGIGKSINNLGLLTFRKVLDFGVTSEDEAVDLFQRPIRLRFPELRDKVPFKKYSIYFGAEPGIQMLEYFNPYIVRQSLNNLSEG